jgi:hypothetical protein
MKRKNLVKRVRQYRAKYIEAAILGGRSRARNCLRREITKLITFDATGTLFLWDRSCYEPETGFEDADFEWLLNTHIPSGPRSKAQRGENTGEAN